MLKDEGLERAVEIDGEAGGEIRVGGGSGVHRGMKHR
jgi:hypothetical protein